MEVIMLERYYLKPTTLDRIRACWMADAIEKYVAWLTENQYSMSTVKRRIPILIHFADFAQAKGAKCLADLAPHARPFAQMWLDEGGTHWANKRARNGIFDTIRNTVEQMLEVTVPQYAAANARRDRPDPFNEQVPGFFGYLREERGLKENSIIHYRGVLRIFEKYCLAHGIAARELSPVILSAFITGHAPGLVPSGQSNLCSELKVFVRYLHRESILRADFSSSIGAPQIYRLSEIPRAISWESVRQMLAGVDTRSAVGKRDYAILLLLVTYGLRAHEVSSITLDDIDWKRERLCVPERKAGHSTAYPLSPLVGNAIIDYLQHGRPDTKGRQLFFRKSAPYLPMNGNSVGARASFYLHKAGIDVRRPGAHTLRHTCVSRLVAAEMDLKTIGDYVGHGSPASTQIYTKIDVEALREVALGDGEAIL
jgi:integrase/recombinase XerD